MVGVQRILHDSSLSLGQRSWCKTPLEKPEPTTLTGRKGNVWGLLPLQTNLENRFFYGFRFQNSILWLKHTCNLSIQLSTYSRPSQGLIFASFSIFLFKKESTETPSPSGGTSCLIFSQAKGKLLHWLLGAQCTLTDFFSLQCLSMFTSVPQLFGGKGSTQYVEAWFGRKRLTSDSALLILRETKMYTQQLFFEFSYYDELFRCFLAERLAPTAPASPSPLPHTQKRFTGSGCLAKRTFEIGKPEDSRPIKKMVLEEKTKIKKKKSAKRTCFPPKPNDCPAYHLEGTHRLRRAGSEALARLGEELRRAR